MVCNADTAGLLEKSSSKQKKESKGEPPPPDLFDPEAGWTPTWLQMFHPMFLGCHSVTYHFLALGVASDVALSLLPVPADITCFANGVVFKRVVL